MMINKDLIEVNLKYDIYDYKNALNILQKNYAKEYNEIIECLKLIVISKDDIVENGGNQSNIAKNIKSIFKNKYWKDECQISAKISDHDIYTSHHIDLFKNNIAIEVEWNNKDTFFDRDILNNNKLYNKEKISLAVIITRSDDLQEVFNILNKGTSYGSSTTHIGKIKNKLLGTECPTIVFGIKPELISEQQFEKQKSLFDYF